MERLGEIADGLGLHRRAARARPRGAAGAPLAIRARRRERDELVGLTVTRPGPPGAPRLCLNGHLDVVAARHRASGALGPWSGAVEDGLLHGRGSVDMKGAVVAALHALAAAEEPPCEVVLQAVGGEEDGGLGTFAALQADDRFDACLIPEPTGFDVVCAQAGALTFSGEVRGRGAHAALRLEGESAIDAYVEVHRALAEHERRGELRRGAPAAGGAGAAVPDLGGAAGGGRVVELGARPRDVRGQAGGAGGGVAGRRRGGAARRRWRTCRSSCASTARASPRARRRSTTPSRSWCSARSPARGPSGCPTVRTCASSASAAYPA